MVDTEETLQVICDTGDNKVGNKRACVKWLVS